MDSPVFNVLLRYWACVTRLRTQFCTHAPHTHTAADLKNSPGSIHPGEPVREKAGCSLTLSDDDFVRLVTGKLNPQQVGRERGRGEGGRERRREEGREGRREEGREGRREEGREGKEREREGKESHATNVVQEEET